jgi:hypothetical protein
MVRRGGRTARNAGNAVVPGVRKSRVRLMSPAVKRDDSGEREPAWKLTADRDKLPVTGTANNHTTKHW